MKREDIKELEQELDLLEDRCDECSSQFLLDICENCDVASHKKDLEMQLRNLRE